MDYEYELRRLFDTVDQYIKANGSSRAAKQALLNAHQFYVDAGFTSPNNKYTAPQATTKSCPDFEHGKACKHGLRQAFGVSCSCMPERA